MQKQPNSFDEQIKFHSQQSRTLADLDPIEQENLAAYILSCYTEWQQKRMNLESVWKECWDAYLGRTSLFSQDENTLEDYSDRSNVNRPVIFEAVETIQSNLLNTLFPNSGRFFSVVSNSDNKSSQLKIMERFLKDKLEQKKFTDKYALFLKQAIITGNSVAAAIWSEEKNKTVDYRPIEILGHPVSTEKVTLEKTLYEGPDFDLIDIFDFYVDPEATDFESATVIHRVEREMPELENSQIYSNLDLLEQAKNKIDKYSFSKANKTDYLEAEVQSYSVKDYSVEKFRLLEVWGDFTVSDKVYENYVCTLSESGVILRFEPNPYDHGKKPFVFSSLIPLPNQIYGLGVVQQSLGLQHTINTLTNQKLDVMNVRKKVVLEMR